MGLFSKIFKKEEKTKSEPKFVVKNEKGFWLDVSSVDIFEDPKFLLFGSEGKSKAYQQILWIYAAVHAIAKAARTVTVDIFRYDEDGNKKLIPLDNQVAKFVLNPKGVGTLGDLLESYCVNILLNGNFFAEVAPETGKPEAIYPLQSHRMKPIIRNGELTAWEYAQNPKSVQLNPRRIFHIKLFNPTDDFLGLSPLECALKTGKILKYCDQHVERFFEKGGTLGGVLETDQVLTDAVYERIKKRWKEAYTGIDRAYEVPILEGGLKFKEVQVPLRDAAIMEIKRLTREDILAIYQVPPGVLGIREAGNRATIEIERRVFWEDTVLPLLDRFFDAFNEQILSRFGGRKVYVAVNTEKIEALETNRFNKTRRLIMLIQNGVLSLNEARAIMNLPPREGGDVYMMPLNMMPVDSGRKPENPGGRPPASEAPESPPEGPTKEFKAFDESDFDFLHSMTAVYLVTKLTELFDNQKNYLVKELNEFLYDHPLASDEELIAIAEDSLKEFREKKKEEYGTLISKFIFALHYSLAKRFGEVSRLTPEDFYDLAESWTKELFEVVDRTTLIQLAEGIRKNIERGMPAEQAINETYRKLVDSVSGERIEKLAQTEATYLVNKTILETAKQKGKTKKTWMTMGDEKVRPEHLALHGVTIDINEKFDVGGYKADCPGDIKLPPELRINCRCWLKVK